MNHTELAQGVEWLVLMQEFHGFLMGYLINAINGLSLGFTNVAVLLFVRCLVPNTSGPMVRYRLLPLGLHFLHGVVKKEIYEHRVDLCFWVLPFDLSPDELHGPDAAS
jgi:hypothetical protein